MHIYIKIQSGVKEQRSDTNDRIINYIREFGSISSWEAYSDLGVTQLGARIDQLKKEGYEFKTEWETSKNRFGEPVSYKRYYLADMVAENMQHIPRLDQPMKYPQLTRKMCKMSVGCMRLEDINFKRNK